MIFIDINQFLLELVKGFNYVSDLQFQQSLYLILYFFCSYSTPL